MLGTLRLILALTVAASHTGLQLGGFNPGVVAVIGFYLISGYVMAGLLRRHYSCVAQVPVFFLDRAVRLLPQYLLYAGLTLAWHFYSGLHTPFLNHTPSSLDLLNNLLIVPLNYYMFNGMDSFTLIPPTWSLGAEIQFYLIAPFIVLWPWRMLSVGALSLGVYTAALGGLLNSDWFGYRLLPGVLLFFMLGASLQHQHHNRQHSRALLTTVCVSALATSALVLLYISDELRQPYRIETLLGLIVGLIVVHGLASQPPNRGDTFAGDLSYGVFLNHFFIMWVLYPQGVEGSQLAGFLVLSVALSWVTQWLVERPLLKVRHRLRKLPDRSPQSIT